MRETGWRNFDGLRFLSVLTRPSSVTAKMKLLLIIFFFCLATNLAYGQSRSSEKPCDRRRMSCFIEPCDGATCPAFPQAQCRNNYCGTCKVEFWVGDTEVTSQCNSGASGARSGLQANVGDECQGRQIRCFSDPCQSESCPGIPGAQCSTAPCECSAMFTHNGADVTQQCRQSHSNSQIISNRVVDSNNEEDCGGRTTQCFSDACAFEFCPKIAGAVCSTSPCTCAAVFRHNGADVTQQCRESQLEVQPAAPPAPPAATADDECQGRTIRCFSDPCAFQTCPGVSGAICSTSPCTCAAVFKLNGADVTQQCQSSQNQVRSGPSASVDEECGGRTIRCFSNACAHETCPSIPSASCSMSPCTCAAKFTDNGADVTQQCRDSRTQIAKDPATTLAAACQGKTTRCFSDTCAFASCSGVPAASCHQSPCTCKAVFLLDGDDVTARCQSNGPSGLKGIMRGNVKLPSSNAAPDLGIPLTTNVGSQPPKPADDCSSNCLFPPCLYSFCAAHPGAECRDDYCNGCKARFFMSDTEVTNTCRDQIPSTGRSSLFGATRSRLSPQPTSRWQPQARRFLSPWFSLFNAMFQ